MVLGEAAPGQQPTARYERPANNINKTLKIEPGQTAKVYTVEIFNLPTNVVAHITCIGNIYKLGLSPETTYADPGFDGDFYIILCNYSDRVVEFRVGQPLARVEFVKLAKSTKKPHPGSGKTREPDIWPRRVDRRLKDQLKQLGIDGLLDELDKKDPPHFEHAFVAREVRKQIAAEFTVLQDRIKDLEQTSAAGVIGRLSTLERGYAWLKLAAWGAGIVIVLLLVSYVWARLPQRIQDKVAEGFAKEIVIVLCLVVPWFFKGIRRAVKLAVFGKQ